MLSTNCLVIKNNNHALYDSVFYLVFTILDYEMTHKSKVFAFFDLKAYKKIPTLTPFQKKNVIIDFDTS